MTTTDRDQEIDDRWRRGCASDRVHLRGASGLPRAAGGSERERMADGWPTC
jgi:hypothetical protein